MNILNIIDSFVDLELECGQLEGKLSSAKNGLNYAQGKGKGWESSIEYAQNQVDTINQMFTLKVMAHDELKGKYISMARGMSKEELEKVLYYVGTKSSNEKGYRAQAYGIVYNNLYSIYIKKLENGHRY